MSLVTLATDFGTRDGYVAQMKGVLLSEGASDIQLVDLSHALEPQDVVGAALFAQAVYPRFPRAVHVMVVDPGVGSERRSLVASTSQGLLVGPDNGVFSLCFEPGSVLHEIDMARLAGPISNTFHGRDVFARVAAALSRGQDPALLGPRLSDPVRLKLPEARFEADAVRGDIIHVDRFGNLISNIDRDALVTWAQGKSVEVRCGERTIGALCTHYAEAAPNRALALFDSSGRLEVAVRDGSASETLNAGRGTAVRIRLAE